MESDVIPAEDPLPGQVEKASQPMMLTQNLEHPRGGCDQIL